MAIPRPYPSRMPCTPTLGMASLTTLITLLGKYFELDQTQLQNWLSSRICALTLACQRHRLTRWKPTGMFSMTIMRPSSISSPRCQQLTATPRELLTGNGRQAFLLETIAPLMIQLSTLLTQSLDMAKYTISKKPTSCQTSTLKTKPCSKMSICMSTPRTQAPTTNTSSI